MTNNNNYIEKGSTIISNRTRKVVPKKYWLWPEIRSSTRRFWGPWRLQTSSSFDVAIAGVDGGTAHTANPQK